VKLKLEANPTFRAKVGIPIPGETRRHPVTFVFKHMAKTEFEAFAPTEGASDVDTTLRYVEGWGDEIDEPFSRETLAKLLEAYPGAAFAIGDTYAAELYGKSGRLGN